MTKTLWTTVLAVLLAAGTVLAADQTFRVMLEVDIEGETRNSSGSGSFVVGEGDFGRLNVAFYGDGYDFTIRAIGPKQQPTLFVADNPKSNKRSEDIMQTVDLVVRPVVESDLKVRLRGVLSEMKNTNPSGEPLFELAESEIDMSATPAEALPVKLKFVPEEPRIKLRLSVHPDQELVYRNRVDSGVTFESQYRLINETSGETLIDEGGGTLWFSLGGKGRGTTTHHKLLQANSDDVLFMSLVEISDPAYNSDNTITFDFNVTHLFAVNPIDTSLLEGSLNIIARGRVDSLLENLQGQSARARATAKATGLEAESMYATFFRKSVTVRPNERIEIEVPANTEDVLGFEGREIFELTSEVREIVR